MRYLEHTLAVLSSPVITGPAANTVSCTKSITKLLPPSLQREIFQGSVKMDYDKLISANHKKLFICGKKDGLLKSSESLNVNNK